MGRSSLYLIPLLLCLSSCAIHAGASPVPRGSWTNQCFAGLEQAAQDLAGPQAIDCGFNTGETGLACARSALKNGLAFRLGFGGVGTDSYICDVVTRSLEGQVFRLDYDSDVTGQMGTSGEDAALLVLRCGAVTIRSKWLPGSSPLSVARCETDNKLTDSIVSTLRGREP